jgi:hypothetical protein
MMSSEHQQSLISSLKNSLELGFTYAEIADSERGRGDKNGFAHALRKARAALAEVRRFEDTVIREIGLEIHARRLELEGAIHRLMEQFND